MANTLGGTGPTYLGTGDATKHRREYRPGWLANLADDVTIAWASTSPEPVTRGTSLAASGRMGCRK
jgi:hypothetical protein